MLRKILCGILGCFLIATICSAEERKDEWKDTAFDFKTIKTSVIVLSVDKSLSLDEYSYNRVLDLVTTKFIQGNTSGVRFITYEQFKSAAGKYSELDLKQLQVDDPQKYNDTVREWLPIISDAVLTISIRQWGYTQVYVPESTSTYTDYQTATVTEEVRDAKGKLLKTITREIKVPIEKTYVTPAHYVTTAHAGAEIALSTTKDQRKVWMYLDLRDAAGSKIPAEMTERIFTLSMDRYRNLIGK